jgi:hypothetical protein
VYIYIVIKKKKKKEYQARYQLLLLTRRNGSKNQNPHKSHSDFQESQELPFLGLSSK